jgi:hypothetical protein
MGAWASSLMELDRVQGYRENNRFQILFAFDR